MKKKFKRIIFVISGLAIFVVALMLVYKLLYTRRTLGDLNYDPDYYWAEKSTVVDKWEFKRTYAGYDYFLYLPPENRVDRHNESAMIPMYVAFHGSSSRGISLGRYGKMFTSERIQSIRHAAVLVILSRGDYFSDCHDTSLLIQNVLMQNECIDKKSIIAYGHSQGAYYVVRMACYQPELFKGVISGSGYYQITLTELLKVLPVQFYFAISKNDLGIYEQGWKTGKRLASHCRNSVYAEYENRGHFWVEPQDEAPGSGIKFLDWLDKVLNE